MARAEHRVPSRPIGSEWFQALNEQERAKKTSCAIMSICLGSHTQKKTCFSWFLCLILATKFWKYFWKLSPVLWFPFLSRLFFIRKCQKSVSWIRILKSTRETRIFRSLISCICTYSFVQGSLYAENSTAPEEMENFLDQNDVLDLSHDCLFGMYGTSQKNRFGLYLQFGFATKKCWFHRRNIWGRLAGDLESRRQEKMRS